MDDHDGNSNGQSLEMKIIKPVINAMERYPKTSIIIGSLVSILGLVKFVESCRRLLKYTLNIMGITLKATGTKIDTWSDFLLKLGDYKDFAQHHPYILKARGQ